jgi:hypothetical protein
MKLAWDRVQCQVLDIFSVLPLDAAKRWLVDVRVRSENG